MIKATLWRLQSGATVMAALYEVGGGSLHSLTIHE